MAITNLKINAQSIRTELQSFEHKPYNCLFEYIWNAFDAHATEVWLYYTLPYEGIGTVKDVVLVDNGNGWDFNDDATTNNFMSSTKRPNKNKTLPKGQFGRGRYSFIWIAEQIDIYSKSKKLILRHNTEIQIEDTERVVTGTEIHFVSITHEFSDALGSKNLRQVLAIEFGWFISQNPELKIFVNDELLDIKPIIKRSLEYTSDNLPKFLRNCLPNDFYAQIVVWKYKPSEYSKFYFLDTTNIELSKTNTGLNKKSDDFWHSVYIKSSAFSNEVIVDESQDNLQTTLDFNGNIQLVKQLIYFFKKELTDIRKPYLKQQSDIMYQTMIQENAIPNLHEFGIYDTDSFGELLKTIYTISPSLFTNKSSAEKKFVCATFAGLLSTQDDNLVKIILEQLQELTEEEKQDLLDILHKTKLSNVVATIKEIDHRLDVIEKLKYLFSEHERDTLEVKHIQKILDTNFWIFGEQFRLFSTTEGALKNTLSKYATEILGIESPVLDNQPNGEVDLFLTKTEYTNETCQKNIIVELKRASKILGKKEYDQIYGYMDKIRHESTCNGVNQYWEFYLIGKDYDDFIYSQMDSARNHGEFQRGLCLVNKDGHFKIYVRKWSDILEAEWGCKMKYLKDKLQKQSHHSSQTPDEVTKELSVK